MKTPLPNALLQGPMDAAGYRINKIGGSRFDIRSYGAAGDGSTDDTDAIVETLDAIPASGGVLYVPAGRYKYTGETLTIDKQVTVLGDGGFNEFQFGTALSTIDFDSDTGTLFDVKVSGCAFKDLLIRNTSPTTPTAGAGILITGNGSDIFSGSRARFENLSVDGFYICVDVQAGSCHVFNNCVINAPVLYGVKLRNILLPDGGDHNFTDCYFLCGAMDRVPTAALRIESGGGIKIVNTKINAAVGQLVHGIYLAVGDGIDTVDFLLANSSIENYSGAGFKGTTGTGTSRWREVHVTGCQFAPVGTGSEYGIHLDATDAGDFSGVCLTSNYGLTPTSSNPFIYLQKCTGISIVGNAADGFNKLFLPGTGNSYARSAVVPPGGTTGQSLKKASNDDFDVVWG